MRENGSNEERHVLGFSRLRHEEERRRRKVGWASKQQRRGETGKKEIKRQTVSKVPTRNKRARRENAVARTVELSIKENDPNCIERLLAHYEILKAIPARITRVVEITYCPCRCGEHGIVIVFFFFFFFLRSSYAQNLWIYQLYVSRMRNDTREKERDKCRV